MQELLEVLVAWSRYFSGNRDDVKFWGDVWIEDVFPDCISCLHSIMLISKDWLVLPCDLGLEKMIGK